MRRRMRSIPLLLMTASNLDGTHLFSAADGAPVMRHDPGVRPLHFSFGPGTSDVTTMSRESIRISLPESLRFLGTEIETVFLNTNGFVTMGEEYDRPSNVFQQTTTKRIPSDEEVPMAAAIFQTDFVVGKGETYGRSSRDYRDLQVAKDIVDKAPDRENSFIPTAVFVGTWFEKISTASGSLSSFQMALAYGDGDEAWAIYSYSQLPPDVSFHTPTAPRIGFQGRDGILISTTVDGKNLLDGTNCGIPGTYAYRLDKEYGSALGTLNVRSNTETLHDLILLNENLTEFKRLLDSVGLLDGILDGSESMYTVFAPTDDAIRASENAILYLNGIDEAPPRWSEHILATARNHIAQGSALAYADIFNLVRTEIDTLHDTLVVSQRDGQVGPASIVTRDILASNGVLHIVDKVIKPEFFSASFAKLELQAEFGPDYLGGISMVDVVDLVEGRQRLHTVRESGMTYAGCRIRAFNRMGLDDNYLWQTLNGGERVKEDELMNVNFTEQTLQNFVEYQLVPKNYYMEELPNNSVELVTPISNCGASMWVTKYSGKLCFNDGCVVLTPDPRQFLASNGVGYVLDRCPICPGVAMLTHYAAEFTKYSMYDVANLFIGSEWNLRNLSMSVGDGSPVTMFASINTAFDKWATSADTIRLSSDAWRHHLWDLLKHSLLQGKYTKQDLKNIVLNNEGNPVNLTMLTGQNVLLEYDRQRDTLVLEKGDIFMGDIKGIDGLLHFSSATPLPVSAKETAWTIAKKDPRFSTHTLYIESVFLDQDISRLMPLTALFAPNEAFEGTVFDLREIADSLLKNFVFKALFSCEKLRELAANDERIESHNGRLWKVFINEKGFPCFETIQSVGNFIKSSCISKCDVWVRNGIMHELDSLLVFEPVEMTSPSTSPRNSPSVSPSPSASTSPSFGPSQVPSLQTTASPSTSSSESANPSVSIAPTSSQEPSASRQPSTVPTKAPSYSPAPSATAGPTNLASQAPSLPPTFVPSLSPSVFPTQSGAPTATEMPSAYPSSAPSDQPRSVPSSSVAPSASQIPSVSVVPSLSPSSIPSIAPSTIPTVSLVPTSSENPTDVASDAPSVVPSMIPSTAPSQSPTASAAPSTSSSPTPLASETPSDMPSDVPSIVPSASSAPSTSHSPSISRKPSLAPSDLPSDIPSENPSASLAPSLSAVPSMSSEPSLVPTLAPKSYPSVSPSTLPSANPSMMPSALSSTQPSAAPSSLPSGEPSKIFSSYPSEFPSISPSGAPATPEPTPLFVSQAKEKINERAREDETNGMTIPSFKEDWPLYLGVFGILGLLYFVGVILS